MITTHQTDRLTYFTFRPLEAVLFLRHGFIIKSPGFAGAGITPAEADTAATALGFDRGSLVLPKQQHGDLVAVVEKYQSPYSLFCDALITARPGMPIAIQVADCIPVFLVDTVRQVIGLAHAGWRGVVNRIIPKAIEQLLICSKGNIADLAAVIGPSIRSCCFQVQEDVAGQFDKHYVSLRQTHGYYIDLQAMAADQLRGMGVPAANIHDSRLCTMCRPDLFYSYRRDEKQGRMLAMMGLK